MRFFKRIIRIVAKLLPGISTDAIGIAAAIDPRLLVAAKGIVAALAVAREYNSDEKRAKAVAQIKGAARIKGPEITGRLANLLVEMAVNNLPTREV